MSAPTSLRQLEKEVGELVDRHDRGRSLAEFRAFGDRPVAFVREVLGGEPWTRQEEIAETVRDHPLTVVRSANAAGKDWIAARLALWWAYTRKGLVLVTGPTERQVREVVMEEVRRGFSGVEDLPGELYTTALRLNTDEPAGILAFTSTEASKLTGFHAPRVLAILTEAQGVDDFAWEGLLACATGPEDRVLAVGNPLQRSGRFYHACRSDEWHSVQISAHEHPNLDPTSDRTISGGPSRAFVERIASEYGRDSGVYTARVEGEFPSSDVEALCSWRWIEAAQNRWESRQLEAEARETQLILAVDVARYGSDKTVLACRQGPVVRELVSWGQASTTETAARVQREAARLSADWGPKGEASVDVVVDEVGVGGGVLDALQEEDGVGAVGFNAGSGARRSVRFANARAEAYWTLRRLLEAGEVALPSDDALAEELTSTRWAVTTGGKVKLEPKDELRSRLGRSPDRADAVAMAFHARLQPPPAMVTVEPVQEPPKRFKPGESGWLKRGSGDMDLGPGDPRRP